MSFQADYHIHHHVDPCADTEMTLPNIDEAAHAMGLQEIAVLTHCSTQLPGGKEDWGWWHKLRKDRFAVYLSEVRSFSSEYGTQIYSGIETELVDDSGRIAATDDLLHKVDMAALSLHYLPDIAVFPWLPDDFPPIGHGVDFQKQYQKWQRAISDIPPAFILEALAEAHIKAIQKNPKIRTLAHLDDMSYTPGLYGIRFEAMNESLFTEILEPLMRAVAEHEVLWEITEACPLRPMFRRAKELGVRFTPTSDAHFISDGWGPLSRRRGAVEKLESMGLAASPVVIR